MAEWLRAVINKWTAEGVKINAGASISLIEKAQNSLNFEFPDDFKNFYLAVDGFADLDWQEHMFYFWPLERIMAKADEIKDDNFIPFCDFLLAAHYIGFKRNETGIFKMYSILDTAENESITDNFKIAVGMINSSSDLIY